MHNGADHFFAVFPYGLDCWMVYDGMPSNNPRLHAERNFTYPPGATPSRALYFRVDSFRKSPKKQRRKRKQQRKKKATTEDVATDIEMGLTADDGETKMKKRRLKEPAGKVINKVRKRKKAPQQ